MFVKETQQVKDFLHHLEASLDQSAQQTPPDISVKTEFDTNFTQIDQFLTGLSTLTPTERVIYNAHVSRMTTKEILASMNIKENTLKYHNRNIYSKLGVSSKAELLEVYKQMSDIKDVLAQKKNR